MTSTRAPTWVLYTDGASRGNPGPASFGYVLYDAEGTRVEQGHGFLGRGTNNEAEYEGLVAGLGAAWSRRAEPLEVRMDSSLVVNHMNGDSKQRAPNLRHLFEEAGLIADRFLDITFVHIPRELNKEADRLANKALDER